MYLANTLSFPGGVSVRWQMTHAHIHMRNMQALFSTANAKNPIAQLKKVLVCLPRESDLAPHGSYRVRYFCGRHGAGSDPFGEHRSSDGDAWRC